MIQGGKLASGMLLCAFLLLGGCDMVHEIKHGLEQAAAVSARLEKQWGEKPSIGIHYSNSDLSSVSVKLTALPKNMSIQQVADSARQAIEQEFKQQPTSLVLSFKKDGQYWQVTISTQAPENSS